MIPSVYSLNLDSFEAEFPELKKFRFSQIKTSRLLGYLRFDEYGNLGKETINALNVKSRVFSSTIINRSVGSESCKVLIELEDGEKIEAVRILSGSNLTACLSSQSGCALGCKFCATGTLGFKRNLKDYEIIEQFYHLKRIFGKIENIVFMGMGEPLLNLEAVSSAISFFTSEEKISARRITVSTSGIPEGIKMLAAEDLGVKLTLSLVAADQNLREKLMPIAIKYKLDEIKSALLYYQSRNRRRITLACCLLDGINVSLCDVDKIKNFAKGLICHVNLIPWNKTHSLPFSTPDGPTVRKFMMQLKKNGIECSLRNSKGDDINAACGELVGNV